MSTIKLYRNCKITEEKNFQVDQIYDYLGSFSGGDVKVFNNCQYIKQGLDAEVKVTLDQTYLDKQWTNMFNYCSIEMNNGGLDNTYYYFIREKKWISKDAIKLILRLDVLNTFNGQYKLTDKTTIQREHKDRFIKEESNWYLRTTLNTDDWEWESGVGVTSIRHGEATYQLPINFKGRTIAPVIIEYVPNSGTEATNINSSWNKDEAKLTINATKIEYPRARIPTGEYRILVQADEPSHTLIRNIDFQSEGMNPTLFKKEESIIYDDSKMNWYLVYTSDQEYTSDDSSGNTISCFLIPENSIKVTVSSTAGGYDSKLDTTSYINTNDYYYILGVTDNLSAVVEGSNDGTTWHQLFFTSFEVGGGAYEGVWAELHKNGNQIEVVGIKNGGGYNLSARYVTQTYTYNYIRIGGNREKLGYRVSSSRFNVNSYQPNITTFGESGSWNFREAGGTSVVDLDSINFIDRTDSKLIKIIELPYCPAPIELESDGTYKFNEGNTTKWYYFGNASIGDGKYKCFKLIQKYIYENLSNNLVSELNPLQELVVTKPVVNGAELRDDKYESKLLHSDFTNYKFVYDNFHYIVKLEHQNIDPETFNVENNFNIKFNVTNTINSRFLFTFKDYDIKNGYEDYNNILYVARNNEITLFNSAYLNYLRTGYNYDVKNKELNQIKNGLGIGLSAASLVAGIVATATGVGAPMGAAAIVGGIGGLASSISGTIIGDIQTQNGIEAKMTQLKNQAVSVQGADDVDLLNIYTNGDKMKVCKYSLSDISRKLYGDLFYYCGYNCGYQDVPDTESRYWFNYIQCEPVFDEDRYTVKMGKECKDELISKYQQGITVLHGHFVPEDGEVEWDFDQEKENWETWLIQ